MNRLSLYPLLILMLLLASCSQTSVAAQPPVNISIAGSTAFFPVLFELTEAFSARHPNVVFDVRGGGSSFGEEQLRQGKISLAATTYLTPQNAITAEGGDDDGVALTSSVRIPIGLDGLAIIVNRKNRIDNLSLVELQEIYSGRVLDWGDLGGSLGEILLVIREDDSGALELFESRVMGDAQVSLTAVIMPTNADILRYVALNPTAIGYISRGYIMSNSLANTADGPIAGADIDVGGLGNGTVRPESEPVDDSTGNVQRSISNGYLDSLTSEREKVTAVAIDGQLPTRAAILNQRYYLVHPLYLVAADEPSGWLALFVDFALSPSGQEIVAHYHAPVR